MSITKEIIIVGAGGFGRELLQWTEDFIQKNPGHKIKGFIDDNPNALDEYDYSVPIVGSVQNYLPKPNQVLTIAIGNPKLRLEIAKTLKSKGAQFINLIHPTARINPNVTLGEGLVICPYVIVANDATLGDFILINSYSTIAHDVNLGDGVSINGHCDITGYTTLGKGVLMGSRSGTIPGVTVGEFSVVASGSTVMKKTKANITVLGTPAKVLK